MDAGKASDVLRGPSTSERRADTERLEAQLAEWTAVIAHYRARAKRADGEAKVQWDGIADDLQRHRNQAGEQVLLVKDSGDGLWKALRFDLDRSWQDIRAAFREAAGRF